MRYTNAIYSFLKDITLEIHKAKQVTAQDWMKSPETVAIMKALAEGEQPHALFVGGCVRNMLLGREVGDIDIATVWTPDQVIERLSMAGIKVVPTGIEHGTVTAVSKGSTYEITSLRKDIQTDGRRAVVKFTDNWLEDAQRRDFTINTLLADSEGNIYDPLGEGLHDLERGRVRFVGDPAVRIKEDYLRILRFFRFHANYGKGEPDSNALEACAAAAHKVKDLSRERVTQEFLKILSVDDPVDILKLMFQNKILCEISFKEYQENLLRHLCNFQKRYGLRFIASRLLVLAGFEPENVRAIDQSLLLPKVFKKDIEAIYEVWKLPDLNADHHVRVAVYKYGRVPTAQALMIELAQDRVMNADAPKALNIIQKWKIPDFPVSGHDLMKAGVKEGPELGKRLADIEEWWIAQDFSPDKKQCLERLSLCS